MKKNKLQKLIKRMSAKGARQLKCAYGLHMHKNGTKKFRNFKEWKKFHSKKVYPSWVVPSDPEEDAYFNR